MRWLSILLVAVVILGTVPSAANAQDTADPSVGVPAYALAMHGDLKYPADFTHLDYVNPDAPKGGDITLAAIGTFNSMNPYILEGDSYYTGFGGASRFYETLTDQTLDEPFSEYCLLCETMEVPEDRSYVTYKLRDIARWSDGTPVTADDLIWSFETIMEKGHPFYQDYWKSIVETTKIDDLTVRFDFDPAERQNRELPLISGQLPVFQKAWWSTREFDKPFVDEVPVSSGPYKIVDVEAGRGFTFERDPNYWGVDLPLNAGRNNFERIRVDYYRDASVAVEAFKAGEYDFRYENSSKNWATAYEFPAITTGECVKELIPNRSVNGMQGFVFNMRKDLFADRNVRKAIGYAFDFEWSNKNLFYDQYTRTKSYWDNSDLANPGGVPTGKEAEYLELWRDELPAEVFSETYVPPSTGGTEEGLRANLAEATVILEEAGWTVNDEGSLVNADGETFQFEILLSDQAWERITQPFIDNLKRLGIEASIRMVDRSQYETIVEAFDYDMIVYNRGMSPSPGNEQRNYWTCESAEIEGSQNYNGVCSTAVDALVENVVQASSRGDLVAATHALDRALVWDYLVVPHWHIASDRVAYWNVLSHPETPADYGIDFNTWWYNADMADMVRQAQADIGFVDVQATVDAAATLGITPPPTIEPTEVPAAIEPTVGVTETAEVEPVAETGGGFPGGPVGIAIAVIVVLGAVLIFARRRGEQ